MSKARPRVIINIEDVYLEPKRGGGVEGYSSVKDHVPKRQLAKT